MTKDNKDISKFYVFFYVAYIMIGFVQFGFYPIQAKISSILRPNEPEISNTVAVYGSAGCLIGSLLASLLVKTSKRIRLISGNVIMLISSPLHFYDLPIIVIASSFMYGTAIGFLSSLVPFYIKEIVPKRILLSTLTLLMVSLLVGNNTALIPLYIMKKEGYYKDSVLGVLLGVIPAILSLIQLLLSFLVFNKETPIKLLYEGEHELALCEWKKMYNNGDKALKKYNSTNKSIIQRLG